jgi:hypothetical protein
MDNLLIYPWQSAYSSALWEFDPSKIAARVRVALSSIEERLRLSLICGDPEYQAIQDARSGITVLKTSIPKMPFGW